MNYKEYKKLKDGTPTCGECKNFISSNNRCKVFTTLRDLKGYEMNKMLVMISLTLVMSE